MGAENSSSLDALIEALPEIELPEGLWETLLSATFDDASPADASTVPTMDDEPVVPDDDATDLDALGLDAPDLDTPDLDAPDLDTPDLDTAGQESVTDRPAAPGHDGAPDQHGHADPDPGLAGADPAFADPADAFGDPVGDDFGIPDPGAAADAVDDEHPDLGF